MGRFQMPSLTYPEGVKKIYILIIIVAIITIIIIALFILNIKQCALKFTSKTWLKYHIKAK